MDAYAPDRENGLHNHEYIPKPKDTIEEENQVVTEPLICMVCDQVKAKHAEFRTCPVCYMLQKQEDFFVLT